MQVQGPGSGSGFRVRVEGPGLTSNFWIGSERRRQSFEKVRDVSLRYSKFHVEVGLFLNCCLASETCCPRTTSKLSRFTRQYGRRHLRMRRCPRYTRSLRMRHRPRCAKLLAAACQAQRICCSNSVNRMRWRSTGKSNETQRQIETETHRAIWDTVEEIYRDWKVSPTPETVSTSVNGIVGASLWVLGRGRGRGGRAPDHSCRGARMV